MSVKKYLCVVTSIHGSTVVHQLNVLLPLLVALLGLLTVHVLRAVSVRPETAARWAAARSLTLTPKLQQDLLAYLRRLRWGRVWCTAAVGAVTVSLVIVSEPPISFLGLPLLMAVVIVELLAPQPRRARTRVASLQHRPRSYFAPQRALRVVRVLLLAGVSLSIFGVTPLGTTYAHGQSQVHLVSLLAGWGLLEYGLTQLTRRGLCDRTEDAALDYAMRVADARSLTATGLMFGCWGLFLALGAVPVMHTATAAMVLSPLSGILIPLAAVWAITLWQPLPSWSPA
jgi:hypothetical protein